MANTTGETKIDRHSGTECATSKLGVDFFARNIHEVARDLLGRDLVRVVDGETLRGRIVEVEVYEGANDAASHARKGEPTERTRPMFAEPGTVYVYTIYGMYQCLNLRAPSAPGPGAILVRACRPMAGQTKMAVGRGIVDDPSQYGGGRDEDLLSGPGKLCQGLWIGPELTETKVGHALWLEAGSPIWNRQPDRVETTERVGLNPKTCGESAQWPWRYIVGDSPWTSI